MNPIKNVTDPHSIKAIEIPSINEAKPAGEICGGADDLLREESDGIAGDWSDNGIGKGGERSRLRTRDESSKKILDS